MSNIAQLKQQIEEHMCSFLEKLEAPNALKKSMLYSVTSGGKRIRPLIILLGLQDLGIPVQQGLEVACAIEMIHTYSLIHDDLPAMDNDEYRRGKLTNHMVFGEDTAILAGDALLTHAFGMILNAKDLENQKKVRILKEMVKAIGASGMVGGQILDMYYTANIPSVKELQEIHHLKTQELIRLCYFIVGEIADLHAASKSMLDLLSHHVGMAFQILDDLADFEIQNSSDQLLKKATYPSILGKTVALEMYHNHKKEALKLARELFVNTDSSVLIERILHV